MDAMTRWQKKFEETMTESLKRQRDLVDSHYTAGLRTLEEMFRVGQTKSPQEYQDKVLQLYRQCFDSLRQLSESQMKEFKSGARPATLMHQLAKGYSDEQIEAIAAYFAAQKK